MAVLVGMPASDFSIAAAPLDANPPAIPAGVPSTLLERRPDVAAAERTIAAANAQIGVATAAYYPTVSLGASGGFESTDVESWLEWPARVWSFGPSVTETVFDGGKRGALTAQARAAYDERVANYRQTVLAAFQNVEDQIAALRYLENESARQDRAVAAARDSVRITTSQYKAGIVSFLNVAVVQASALQNERTAVDLLGRRMVASVLLVQAVGGGWSTDELPATSTLAADCRSGPRRRAPDRIRPDPDARYGSRWGAASGRATGGTTRSTRFRWRRARRCAIRFERGARMDIPSWAVGGLIVIAFVLGRVSATPPAATPSRTLPPSSPIDVAAADAEIATLIQAGRTIDAIKRYRTVHGVDLKAAKDAIDALVARRLP